MILAGIRVNTLVHLKVTSMNITDTEVTFTFDVVLKHSRPSYKQKPLIFRTFISWDLSPVTTLITYLDRRLPVSDDQVLFITIVKPHKKLSKKSISWWIKLTMSETGINFKLFTSHRCRLAFASKEFEANGVKVNNLVWRFDNKKNYLQRNPARISTSWWYFWFTPLDQRNSSKNLV